MSERVLLGMSGGVDSAAAALLLRKQGFEVRALALRLGEDGDPDPAARVCERLGIPLSIQDARARFEHEVLAPCWESYSSARTPNPCALCNPRVKLHLLLDRAGRLGIGRVATGHHARVEQTPAGPVLCRGCDASKDQSYFLFGLGRRAIERLLLPVGEIDKCAARRLVEQAGCASACAIESQDACAARDDETFARTLAARFGDPPPAGPICDMAGRVLGRHAGLHCYTVGQRRGLGLASSRPSWVVRLEPEGDRLIVSHDRADLHSRDFAVFELQLGPAFQGFRAGRCTVQIRSRHRPAAATVERCGADRARVCFEDPQRAITPGQAAVIYEGARVVGGGWIALPPEQTQDGRHP
ncbi:MAG: tRNA 2-thiouridine(34) synthase MnmA [Deltaproteobacteria bacterium]|nr:tRNA 2-thiouridine(34) synthase MnmA [Deltaproteobacteria bacterium]